MSTITFSTPGHHSLSERLAQHVAGAREYRRFRRVERELAHLSEIDPRMHDEALYAITRNR